MTLTGPDAARALVRAGFRVVPNLAETKRPPPRCYGFGEAYPDFSYPPEHFEPDEHVAILTGFQPTLLPDGRELTILDLDGGADRAWLEQHVGKLPPTLTTKAGAHLFFRHARRNDFRQWGDALRTRRAGDARALDLKRRGGYARQPLGDRGFVGRDGAPIPLEALTPERVCAEVAELPPHVIDQIVALNSKRRCAVAGRGGLGELDFEEGRNWRDYTENWPAADHAEVLAKIAELGPLGNDGLMLVATAIRRWGYGLSWDADGTPSGSAVQMFELWDRLTAPLRAGAPEVYWFVPEWVGAVHRALARCARCNRNVPPAQKRGFTLVSQLGAK